MIRIMKNKTFDEIVENAAIAVNEAVMLGGAAEMKKVLHAHIENAILWNALQQSNMIKSDSENTYHRIKE